MSAETVEPVIDMPHLAGDRWAVPVSALDREFWMALGVAALLHLMLLISVATSHPHRIGDENGADDGISISVVTEADLQSRSTVSAEAEPPPGAPVAAPPPPPPAAQPEPQPPQPAPETPPAPQVETQAEPPTEPPKTEPQKDIKPSLTDDVPDLLAIPEPTKEAAAKNAAAPPKPQKTEAAKPPQKQQTAKLDLTPAPSDFNAQAGGGGRFAGASRPPGITRSGANNDFGRKVVAELQKTMPQLRDTLGHVLVRIVLNQNGNVVEVKVFSPSGVAGLDQSVVFAVKQTNFPFPPPNATDADLIFQVRYNYL